jgi:ribokinase
VWDGYSVGMDVAVVGQVARDLVLLVDELPGPGRSTPVRERRETLGGKGANQAVSLAQLGGSAALIGVVGDDGEADRVLDRARTDGLDVSGVIRRQGTRTGLIVDVVDADARWRYFEDLPPAVLLTEGDVVASSGLLRTAGAVLVQLQQPTAAALTAARTAHCAGSLVVLDGAPADRDAVDGLLGCADVVRADARETELLAGAPVPDVPSALRVARMLLAKGPRLAALSVGDAGNVFVWPDGEIVVPLADVDVVDTTGAGDAFTAALTLALLRGGEPAEAARAATAAAAATVGHAGGRPRLTPEIVRG